MSDTLAVQLAMWMVDLYLRDEIVKYKKILRIIQRKYTVDNDEFKLIIRQAIRGTIDCKGKRWMDETYFTMRCCGLIGIEWRSGING